jgi:hypothetical protein
MRHQNKSTRQLFGDCTYQIANIGKQRKGRKAGAGGSQAILQQILTLDRTELGQDAKARDARPDELLLVSSLSLLPLSL